MLMTFGDIQVQDHFNYFNIFTPLYHKLYHILAKCINWLTENGTLNYHDGIEHQVSTLLAVTYE